MRRTQLLISRLSKEEQLTFFRWLRTELNGRQPRVLNLLEGLIKELDDVALWKSLYSELPPDMQELGRKYGQLLVHLEEFLAIQAFRKDRLLRDRILLRRLNELRLGKEFMKYANKVRKRINQSGLRDKNYFAYLFALEGELLQHGVIAKIKSDHRPYRQYREAFLAWWSQLFMDQRIIEKARKQKLATNIAPDWEDKMVALIEEFEQSRQHPVLSLQFKFERALDGKETEFYAFLAEIKKHQYTLPWDTRYNLLAILMNYTNRKRSETGDPRYLFQSLKLQQLCMEEKWMFIGKYLPASAFKNYITVRNIAVFLVETQYRQDWIHESWAFLEEYKQYLAPNEAEEVLHYTRNLLHFYSGNYETLLRRRKFGIYSRPSDELETRILILFARYEDEDLYGIEANIRSVWQYIHIQPSFSKSRKKREYAYLNILKKMIKAENRNDWNNIQASVEQLPISAKREWLLNKIGDKLPSES